MSGGYFHTFPSPYHLKRLVSDTTEEVEIVQYGINQYHDKCLIGIVDKIGVLKYVNLVRRSHSLFQLHIMTRSMKKAVTATWKSFQLYGKNNVLILLEDTNQILETRIPSTPKVDSSAVTVVAEHDKFIDFLHCNPLNSKTFLTGTPYGEIKLWHVVHPQHRDGIPSTTILWTIQAFPESLSTCNLFYHKTNEIFHFLLFAASKTNHLKLFNLRTRKVEEETYVESYPLVLMKHIGGESKVPSYIATVNSIGTLHIWTINLELKQTLYLERNYKVHSLTSFFSPSVDTQVLVVSMSKKEEMETKLEEEDSVPFLGEENKKHIIRFYDLQTDAILKEFLMPSAVLFCSLVTTFQKGKDYLVIGNEGGVLNAWVVSDLHLNPKGEKQAEPETEEEEEEEEEDENVPRKRLEIEVLDDDDEDIPQPLRKVPVPTPKELTKKLFDFNDEEEGEEVLEEEEEFDDEIEPRSGPPIPFEIQNTSKHSILSNKPPGVLRHQEESQITEFQEKVVNEPKYKPKVKMPEPPKDPVKPERRKVKSVRKNQNFGKPEQFTSILEEEAIRRSTLKDSDVPTHRFSRLRVMQKEELDDRIREIEDMKLDEEQILAQEMERREKMIDEKNQNSVEPTNVPKNIVNYANLVSLNVNPKKYEKKKRAKKRLHPNYLEERKESRPRMFNEFFHPHVFDQEMAYIPKMNIDVSLEPMDISNILEIGQKNDMFHGDVL